MSAGSELKARIAQLLHDADARQADRTETRREEMAMLHEKVARFDAMGGRWMNEILMPRMQWLSDAFPHASPPTVSVGGLAVVVALRPTEDYPASAQLEATLTHDLAAERAHLEYRASVIPMLMDYVRQRRLEVTLDEREAPRVCEFTEECVLQFVSDYLRLRDPTSPYQRDRLVTDPVCGMTFRRAETADSAIHEGRRIFFCARACRERFESEPARYVRL